MDELLSPIMLVDPAYTTIPDAHIPRYPDFCKDPKSLELDRDHNQGLTSDEYMQSLLDHKCYNAAETNSFRRCRTSTGWAGRPWTTSNATNRVNHGP